MTARYVWRDGAWIDKATGLPMKTRHKGIALPGIQGDYAAYFSPATGKMIEGRAAHRDDLARSGCRIIEKGEHKHEYRNPTFAEKRGLKMGYDVG